MSKQGEKIVVKQNFSCNGVTKNKGDLLLDEDLVKIGDEKLIANLAVNGFLELDPESIETAKKFLEELEAKEAKQAEEKKNAGVTHSMLKAPPPVKEEPVVEEASTSPASAETEIAAEEEEPVLEEEEDSKKNKRNKRR